MKKVKICLSLCLFSMLALAPVLQAAQLVELEHVPINLSSGGSIEDMAYDPVTKRIFTANGYLNNYVSVVNVDPANVDPFFLEDTVATSSRPTGLAIDPAGRRLFVACWEAGKVGVINLDTLVYTDIITEPGAYKLAYDGTNGLYVEIWTAGLRKYVYTPKTKRWALVASKPTSGYNDCHRILYYKAEDALVRLNNGSGNIEVWKVSGSAFTLLRFGPAGGVPWSGKIASGKLYAALWPSYVTRIDLATLAIERNFPTAAVQDCFPDESKELLYYGLRNSGAWVRLYDLTNDCQTENQLSFHDSSGGRYIEADKRYVFMADGYSGIYVLYLDLICP